MLLRKHNFVAQIHWKLRKRAVNRSPTAISGQNITKNTEAILDVLAGSSPCLDLTIIPNDCIWLPWKGKSSGLAFLHFAFAGGPGSGLKQAIARTCRFSLHSACAQWHRASQSLTEDYLWVLLRAALPTLPTSMGHEMHVVVAGLVMMNWDSTFSQSFSYLSAVWTWGHCMTFSGLALVCVPMGQSQKAAKYQLPACFSCSSFKINLNTKKIQPGAV